MRKCSHNYSDFPTITDACQDCDPPPSSPPTASSIDIHGLYICGGGAFNEALVRTINSYLQEHKYPASGLTSDIGLDPKWVEACAFAWLAKQRLDGNPGNVPLVTGASRPVVLGGVYLP